MTDHPGLAPSKRGDEDQLTAPGWGQPQGGGGLFWPGDHRAGGLFSDAAFVEAMVTVEAAWLAALVDAGVAPASTELPIPSPGELIDGAAEGGNPVIPLVAWLRSQVDGPAAQWLHRGLTSQDVLDTALMLGATDVCAFLREHVLTQIGLLSELVRKHRDTAMLARTLTQPAIPTTFGAKAAAWLRGLLDAADDLSRVTFPAQFGGAAGTRAAIAYVAGDADVTGTAAQLLGLRPAEPWHTTRAPVTRLATSLAGLTAAYAHIANDVLALGRAETGELAEPARAGRGGSSTMPQKQNPVLSVLIRRAGLAAPALVAQLLLAAAEVVDERPDAAWHLEWEPVRLLARHAAEAAAETSELLAGLRVDEARMAANLAAAGDGVHAERLALATLPNNNNNDARDTAYADAAAAVVDATLARAGHWQEEQPWS